MLRASVATSQESPDNSGLPAAILTLQAESNTNHAKVSGGGMAFRTDGGEMGCPIFEQLKVVARGEGGCSAMLVQGR